MKFAYKYRLFPTKTHIEKLETILEHCRELYNSALEHRIGAYKRAKVSITYKDQANSLPEIKEARPEFEEIYSQFFKIFSDAWIRTLKLSSEEEKYIRGSRASNGSRVFAILKAAGL